MSSLRAIDDYKRFKRLLKTFVWLKLWYLVASCL